MTSLAEIKAAAEAATPGRWHIVGPPWNVSGLPWINAESEDPHVGRPIVESIRPDDGHSHENWDQVVSDAAFVALSREAIPWLVSRVEELAEAAKRAKSIAAAPDYDEEAIRDALWALADLALARLEGGE